MHLLDHPLDHPQKCTRAPWCSFSLSDSLQTTTSQIHEHPTALTSMHLLVPGKPIQAHPSQHIQLCHGAQSRSHTCHKVDQPETFIPACGCQELSSRMHCDTTYCQSLRLWRDLQNTHACKHKERNTYTWKPTCAHTHRKGREGRGAPGKEAGENASQKVSNTRAQTKNTLHRL